MKRISNINEPIKNLEGETFKSDKEGKIDASFKSVMIRTLGVFQCQDGEKAIKVSALGVKLAGSTDNFEYEEANEAVLKEVISSNPLGMVAIMQAALYEAVKHSEAFK